MSTMTSRSVRKAILSAVPGWKSLTGRLSVHYSELVGYVSVELMTGLITDDVDAVFNQHGTLKYTNDSNENNIEKIKLALQSQFGITISKVSPSHINRGESAYFTIKK